MTVVHTGQAWTHPQLRPDGSSLTPAPSVPAAEWQVAEATALVHTLDGWSVVQTVLVPTRTPDRKFFSKGSLEDLTGDSWDLF